ncbi:MAG: methionine-R-sulfoxide reductase [Planctomycetaceae bacterium]|nr:methionine-R-sulfoxide reductase [Planctomycetaceae bacterium]
MIVLSSILAGLGCESDPGPSGASLTENGRGNEASSSLDTTNQAVDPETAVPNGDETMTEAPNTSNAQTEYNKLTQAETAILLYKHTEPPNNSAEYTVLMDPGTYICKRCNSPLYRSDDKFHSHCGWPSFDDEIDGAVHREPDADGFRVEIVCNNCGGHLGHVFEGEGLTARNTRHCVNGLSMKFIPEGKELPPVIRPGARERGDADLPELPRGDSLFRSFQ